MKFKLCKAMRWQRQCNSIGRPVENKKTEALLLVHLASTQGQCDGWKSPKPRNLEWIYCSNMDIFESKSFGAVLTIMLAQ